MQIRWLSIPRQLRKTALQTVANIFARGGFRVFEILSPFVPQQFESMLDQVHKNIPVSVVHHTD